MTYSDKVISHSKVPLSQLLARSAKLRALLDNSGTSETKRGPAYSQLRILKVGPTMEISTYSRPIRYGFVNYIRPSRVKFEPENRENIEEKKLHNKQRNYYRAYTRIRQYVLDNFKTTKWYTLTLDQNKCDFDINDLRRAYQEFKLFVKRLRYGFGDFKYIVVPEFQKRGAVHFHFVADLPYIDQKQLSAIWSLGFVWVENRRDVLAVSLYMSKYMTKAYLDKRYEGVRIYRKSNTLTLPKPIYGDKAKAALLALRQAHGKVTHKKAFYSPHNGLIKINIVETGNDKSNDFR